PAPTPAPTPVAGMLVKVKSSTLNVRAGVGTGHPVTTTVRRGEVFTIVETARSADCGTWGRLKSGAGWINIGPAYVDRVGGAAPASAPAYLTVRTNGAALMLRASAAGNARILKRIPNGSRVELVSRGGAWHNVRYQGVTGWVSSQWVK
ncbi:SH3 domain-containing protein, partial [uncultured Halomonas sp.]|uniref:SH3 domain-containing protein n=1 Tax=uncultured Halomonas sp. TaxID=173971 RepID=UPI0026023C53